MTHLIEDDFESYEDMEFSDLDYQSEFVIQDPLHKITFRRKHKYSFVSHSQFKSEGIINFIGEYYEKEKHYVTAIKNLMKQKRYLNLIYEHSHELISDDEFNSELELNEDKYLIHANKKLEDMQSLSTFLKVLIKLREDFTEDDLSEVFSIENPGNFRNYSIHLALKNRLKGFKE